MLVLKGYLVCIYILLIEELFFTKEEKKILRKNGEMTDNSGKPAW